MINRQACFACTTPFQLIGAITIAKEKGLDADIYIFGMFEGYLDVANKLSQYQVFKNVIPVDCNKFVKIKKVRALAQIVRSRQIVPKFLKNVQYSYFFSSSRALVKMLLLQELMRKNENLRIVIYDDGLGTYQQNTAIFHTSPKRIFIEKILKWQQFPKEQTSLLVLRPDLLDLPDHFRDVVVEKAPSLEWCDENKTMITNIFSVSEHDSIKEKVLIFDTVRGFYHNDLGVSWELLDNCYEIILNAFGKQNVICKPHPRSLNSVNTDIKVFAKAGIPVEALYAGMAGLNKRILVSSCSSAVFTPKLMFNVEPIIINLHKIVFPERNEIAESIHANFQSLYENGQRVMAPESLGELTKICAKLAVNDEVAD